MIPVIGLVVGVLAGLFLDIRVPLSMQPYLPIAVVAALDAVFGALRAKLDGVFVTSYVSPAICQSLRDLGRSDVSVVGVDLFEESRKCLENGQLDMVIFQNQQLQGYTAIEMMAEYFHTKAALSDRRIKPEIVIRANASLY